MKTWLYLSICCICTTLFGQVLDLNTHQPLSEETYYCAGQNFKLKLDAEATSTGDYTISPLVNFNETNGTQLVPFTNTEGDNHFSKPIDLGFTFSFYGEDYTQVVVGSNGRLLFGHGTDFQNLHQNDYVDKVLNLPLPNLAYNKIDSKRENSVFNFAQIFAGFTGLKYYNSAGYYKINYKKYQYNGKQAILISFRDIVQAEGNYDAMLSSDILLLEDNSFIIKVIKSTEDQSAILGIQNQDATQYKAEGVFNNGNWKSSGSEAYLFTPSQRLEPHIKWTVNGVENNAWRNLKEITYIPSNTEELLIAELSFFNDKKQIVGIPKVFKYSFKAFVKPNIIATKQSGCAAGYELSVQEPIPGVQYQWYKNSILVGEGARYLATETGAYTVKVASCEQSDPINISVVSDLPPVGFHPNTNFSECDRDALTQKTFNLLSLVKYPPNKGYIIEFVDEAQAVVASASNNYQITLRSGETKKIFLKVTSATCTSGLVPFSISYFSFPKEQKVEKTLCYGTTHYDLEQFEREYSVPGLKYEYSVDGGINYIPLLSINPQLTPLLKVRLSHPDYPCQSVIDLKINIDAQVIAQQPRIDPFELQQCGSATQSFDLSVYEKLINNKDNIRISFYTSEQDARLGNNAIKNKKQFRAGLGETILYARVENALGCVASTFPEIRLRVYSKPKLLKSKIELLNCPGNTIFDLSQSDITSFFGSLDKAITPKITYYDEKNIPLTNAQIERYDASLHGSKPYIKVEFNSTCSEIIEFDLKYYTFPQVARKEILVCAEAFYSLDVFKNAVLPSEADAYEFYDENMTPLTQDWSLAKLPFTAKFYLKNKSNGCVSSLYTVEFDRSKATPVNPSIKEYSLCDTDYDGRSTINLEDWQDEITPSTEAVLRFYKDAAHSIEINNPKAYTNTNPAETIYGVAQAPGMCPSSFSFNIHVNTPIKIQGVEDIKPCYGDYVLVAPSNPSDYQTVAWHLPNGSVKKAKQLSLPYEDVVWGTYTIKATSANGCTAVQTFTISDEQQPKIIQVLTNNNKIEVLVEGGTPPYTYLFNGSAQASNVLDNPTASAYTIQVKSATGCLGMPKETYFLSFHNVITPNGDGINDTWFVEHLDKMEQVNLVITDRYGKPVFSSHDNKKLVWDGTERGRPLPMGSYWYVAKWFDPSTQRYETKQGWIFLRNQ